MRKMRFVLFVLLVACGSTPPTKPSPPSPEPQPASTELSPALVPLAWWLGDWESDRGTEHWVASQGAMFGITLRKDGSFEVQVVDDAAGPGPADGVRRLFAFPEGTQLITFREKSLDGERITFANEGAGMPETLVYGKSGIGLAFTAAGQGQSRDVTFHPYAASPAPELEVADRAFSDDTGARGIEGWVAAFDEHGAMMRKGERIEGHDKVREMMKDTLAAGKLVWEPIASHASGDLGFTVGKAHFDGADEHWKSSYVTIWKKQPDGGWKVWFDTGRPVND